MGYHPVFINGFVEDLCALNDEDLSEFLTFKWINEK